MQEFAHSKGDQNSREIFTKRDSGRDYSPGGSTKSDASRFACRRLPVEPGLGGNLFRLFRLDVLYDRIQPYFAPILVGFDLVKDWPPDWHLTIPVGDRSGPRSVNRLLDLLVGEFSTRPAFDRSQGRGPGS